MSIYSFSIEGAVVLSVACGMVWAMRRASAAARHLVWMCAGIALLVLPVVSLTLPKMRVPLPAINAVDAPVLFAVTTTARQIVPVTPSMPLKGGKTANLPWAFYLWMAGAIVAFSRMFFAGWTLRRMRQAARAFPGRDGILLSPRCTVPLTAGIWRSVIYVPADAAEWPEERLDMVLRHETAHIRRRDAASHCFLRAVLNLHWWNPLAWFAWRQFLKDGEQAADDLVLLDGVTASGYADQLLAVARLSARQAGNEAWAAVAMARPAALEARLRAILDQSTNRRAPQRATVLAACLCAATLTFPLASLRAQDSAVELVKRAEQARKSGSPDEAKRLYEQAAKMGAGPGPAEALLQLALEAKAVNHNDQADELLKQALAANPDGQQAALIQAWIAELRYEAGDVSQAKSLFLRSLSLEGPQSPERATTSELYAQLLRIENLIQESTVMLQQAEAIRKANVEVLSAKISLSEPAAKIGGSMIPPRLVTKVEPSYSSAGRAAKWQGKAILSVTVGEDGHAYNIHLVKSLGLGLDEEAVEAVNHWEFTPATKDGNPVPVVATIEVNFRLL